MIKQPARGKFPEDVQPVFDVISQMVDDFCRERLNEEYAVLCRQLVEKPTRKRPSPLVSGKPNTWACGIIRTIGWVNFLDDRSQTPHMKLPVIDKAFGVNIVRELMGVVASERAAAGIVVTSGSFTDGAQAFARGVPLRLIAEDE
jgi:hypothetical protein